MGKVLTLGGLKRKLSVLRKNNKKVVFTNGCFDIVHAGHVRYLTKARTFGDCLVIGLNSDRSVRAIKGAGRPVVPEAQRAEVLAGLAAVDYVVTFDEPTPIKLIETLRPEVLAKGADWKRGSIVGEVLVNSYGGSVERIKLFEGASTTNIIKKIRALKNP